MIISRRDLFSHRKRVGYNLRCGASSKQHLVYSIYGLAYILQGAFIGQTCTVCEMILIKSRPEDFGKGMLISRDLSIYSSQEMSRDWEL